jgi:hypothetical protein
MTGRFLQAILAFSLEINVAIGHPGDGEAGADEATAILAYETTKTAVWSTTETHVISPGWVGPSVVTGITTRMATTLEPGPVTSYPATVIETILSTVTYEYRITRSDGSSSTSFSSGTYTVPSTWVVSKPQASDLASGTSMGSLPCDSCPAQSWVPDSQCVAKGLDTACQGQCQQRYGDWWCYHMYYSDYSNSAFRMGRACWGGDGEYLQLNTPCVDSDHQMACTPCQGLNYSWGAVEWG